VRTKWQKYQKERALLETTAKPAIALLAFQLESLGIVFGGTCGGTWIVDF
jgi:hypothetical protein